MAMTEDEAKELQMLVKNLVERFTPGRTVKHKRATWGVVSLKVSDAERMDELAHIA